MQTPLLHAHQPVINVDVLLLAQPWISHFPQDKTGRICRPVLSVFIYCRQRDLYKYAPVYMTAMWGILKPVQHLQAQSTLLILLWWEVKMTSPPPINGNKWQCQWGPGADCSSVMCLGLLGLTVIEERLCHISQAFCYSKGSFCNNVGLTFGRKVVALLLPRRCFF